MGKKEIRNIVASDDVAGLIDQGSKIDVELKNLTYQDKGTKSKITEHVSNLIGPGETSVRVEGNTASAVVTASEKFSFDVGNEKFDEVKEGVESGILNDVVKVTKAVRIPPERMEEAVMLLNNAGIAASVTTSYGVNGPAYREFSDEGSPEVAAVKGILDQCIEKTTTFRVKYER